MNNGTENVGVRAKSRALKNGMNVLQDIMDVCEAVYTGKETFAGACRERGLNQCQVRRLILNTLGKCPDKRKDLSSLEPELTDGFEDFYRDVFGERSMNASKLPADYKESVFHVLENGGLTEKEIIVTKAYFGLGEEPITQREVGGRISVSPARVGAIIAKALRKCRMPPNRNILRLGATAYTQREKQKKELAKQTLRHEKELHEKLMEKREQKHQAVKDAIRKAETQAEIIRTALPDILKLLEDTPIDCMKISVRTENCARRAGIYNMFELIRTDLRIPIRNMGAKGMEELICARDQYVMDTYGVTVSELRDVYEERFYEGLPHNIPKADVMQKNMPARPHNDLGGE